MPVGAVCGCALTSKLMLYLCACSIPHASLRIVYKVFGSSFRSIGVLFGPTAVCPSGVMARQWSAQQATCDQKVCRYGPWLVCCGVMFEDKILHWCVQCTLSTRILDPRNKGGTMRCTFSHPWGSIITLKLHQASSACSTSSPEQLYLYLFINPLSAIHQPFVLWSINNGTGITYA